MLQITQANCAIIVLKGHLFPEVTFHLFFNLQDRLAVETLRIKSYFFCFPKSNNKNNVLFET